MASGIVRYTPPKQIVKLKEHLALLPALCAAPGDCILIPGEMHDDDDRPIQLPALPYFRSAEDKGLRLIHSLSEHTFEAIRPWGWNISLRNELIDLGADPALLPTEASIEATRLLSHRRTTIGLNRRLNELLPLQAPLPVELADMASVLRAIEQTPGCYIKTPWSSSGRGILVGGMLSEQLTREWISGALRRQKSVMVEAPSRRLLDFATEWEISPTEVRFVGVSLFDTTPGGSYRSNLIAPQARLKKTIQELCPIDVELLIDAQREALRAEIAPIYRGPAGIDCCIGEGGDLRPCLEVNLRMTMGRVALSLPVTTTEYRFRPGEELPISITIA